MLRTPKAVKKYCGRGLKSRTPSMNTKSPLLFFLQDLTLSGVAIKSGNSVRTQKCCLAISLCIWSESEPANHSTEYENESTNTTARTRCAGLLIPTLELKTFSVPATLPPTITSRPTSRPLATGTTEVYGNITPKWQVNSHIDAHAPTAGARLITLSVSG